MIPTIEKVKVPCKDGREITQWVVEGTDVMCDTLGRAIRYWLWRCGVPAKIAFGGVKSNYK
jgi:hypothetical protein